MSEEGIVYEQDGRIIYRASSFGGCERALVAARLGYHPTPPPARLQQVFQAGHDAEDWVLGKIHVNSAQSSVRLDIPNTNCSIIGHVDGMKDLPKPLRCVVEVKSQSPKEFDKWTEDSWTTDTLWRKYAWQASIYMYAAGNADLELVRVRRPELTFNSDGTTTTRDYEFTTHHYSQDHAPIWFKSLISIYTKVQRVQDATELPPCDRDPAWGCPFWQLHEEEELVEDDELRRACDDFKLAQVNVKRTKEVEADRKAAVIKLLDKYEAKVDGDKTTRAVHMERFRVTLSTFPVKERVTKAHAETRLTVTSKESTGSEP